MGLRSGWRKIKRLARGGESQGGVDGEEDEPSVLRQGFKFLSQCSRAAIQDVWRQITPPLALVGDVCGRAETLVDSNEVNLFGLHESRDKGGGDKDDEFSVDRENDDDTELEEADSNDVVMVDAPHPGGLPAAAGTDSGSSSDSDSSTASNDSRNGSSRRSGSGGNIGPAKDKSVPAENSGVPAKENIVPARDNSDTTKDDTIVLAKDNSVVLANDGSVDPKNSSVVLATDHKSSASPAVTPPTADKSSDKEHDRHTASRSERTPVRPPQFEAKHADKEGGGGNDNEQKDAAHLDDADAAALASPEAAVTAIASTYDPEEPWPRFPPKGWYTERLMESQLAPRLFDHPQVDDDDSNVPSRYIRNWRLYRRRTPPHGGKPRWYPESDFPHNCDMTDYGLEGGLVAPDGTHINIRLDELETLFFDSHQTRWGWWVSSSQDGKVTTAYYRLLDPDLSATLTDVEPHLEQRAFLAVLTGLLAGAVGRKVVDGSVPPPVVSIDPLLDRVGSTGVDALHVLRLYAERCAPYLKCRFRYTARTSSRDTPLENLPCHKVSPASLLKATVALERVAGMHPWGTPAPLVKSLKRTGAPPVDPPAKKKMRFENGPSLAAAAFTAIAASAREVSEDATGSSSSSVPSPVPVAETIAQRRHEDLLSAAEFKGLFTDDEFEDLEECNDIRFGGDSSEHQYGRILPNAAHTFFGLMELSRDDSFVDLGSGIGSLVLQAAYTVGCPSRGIEIVRSRHEAALELEEHTRSRIETLNLQGIRPGSVEFFDQNLISQEAAAVLNDAIRDAAASPRGGYIKAFVNNYEGLMGDRSPGARMGMSPENYIAGQFASWPPGSQLVTISPVRCLGMPVDQAINELRKHDLMAGNATHASFFRLDVTTVGPQNEVASWSHGSGCTKDVRAYRYTRTYQLDLDDDDDDDDRMVEDDSPCRKSWPSSVFLCCNPSCPLAQSGTPLPAIRYDDNNLPLVNTCSCSYQPKSLRRPHQRYM